jgi:hypothetical protein
MATYLALQGNNPTLMNQFRKSEENAPVKEVPGIKYDYIIVGAGSAGCVVARRLVENTDVRILVLEAGGSDAGIDTISKPAPVAGKHRFRPRLSLPLPAHKARKQTPCCGPEVTKMTTTAGQPPAIRVGITNPCCLYSKKLKIGKAGERLFTAPGAHPHRKG